MTREVQLTISDPGGPDDGKPDRDGSVLSTLNADGSRKWIRPRPVFGPLFRKRQAVAWFLIAIFTLLPYINIAGRPAILLDIASRRFTFFGLVLMPTDTELFALLMVGLFLAIFLATALLGRVWCGWACPQTVYMEYVFRPIERFFTGAPGRRPKKGTVSGWLQRTGVGAPLKIVVYFIISCYLAHTFLAYFVGVENLREWVTRSPLEHPTSFVVMLVVTALMMFDFTFFREQTCIVACPYGRMQSALLDRNSIIVSYHEARGEPRGKAKRNADDDDPPLGDCVDCGKCVTCCPTGIDIRNGLQMECIHCTQCIDACNEVMLKIGREPDLIRYSSEDRDAGKPGRLIRPRTVLYPAALLIVFSVFFVMLAGKGATELSVFRGRGIPFTELSPQEIANPVRVRITNRTGEPRTYTARVEGAESGTLRTEGLPITIAPGEAQAITGFLIAAPDAFGPRGKLAVDVVVIDDRGDETTASFQLIGPASRSENSP